MDEDADFHAVFAHLDTVAHWMTYTDCMTPIFYIATGCWMTLMWWCMLRIWREEDRHEQARRDGYLRASTSVITEPECVSWRASTTQLPWKHSASRKGSPRGANHRTG